jgi:predicted dehydrogenase
MKRLGLIGVGAWGRRYIDTIGARNDCVIAAVARASKRVDTVVAGAVACDSWTSVVELAASGDVDGVVAATSPEHQVQVARACIAAGVPLLVEKPLGCSMAAADALRAQFDASERKPPIVVDYVHLWSPAFVELKRRVRAASELGPVVRMQAEGFNWGPLRAWSPLYDYGPHDVSMCLDVLGHDAKFRVHGAERKRSIQPGFELFDVRLELAGVPILVRVGNGGNAKARLFAVEMAGGRQLIYDDTRPHGDKLIDARAPVAVDEVRPLENVLRGFLETIDLWKSGRLSERLAGVGLTLSVRVNGILDAIQSSLRPDGADATSSN